MAIAPSQYQGLARALDTATLIGSAGICDGILAGLGEVRKAKGGKLAEKRLASLLTSQFRGKAKKAVEYIAKGLKSGKITSEADLLRELDYVGKMLGNVSPQDAKEIIAATTLLYSVEKGDIAKTMGLKFALHQADQFAIGALGRDQVWYIGDFYQDAMSKRMREITTNIILNQGLSRDEAARQIKDAMSREFGIGGGPGHIIQLPTGWTGTPDGYFKMMASTIHDRAANLGRVVTFTEAGVSTYRIDAVLDERTSDICKVMDGKTFDIKYAQDYAQRYYSATDKDEVEKVVMWRDAKDIRPIANDEAALAKAGMALPPYHGSCRTVVVAIAFQPIGGGPAPVMAPIKPPAKPAPAVPGIPRVPAAPKAPPKPTPTPRAPVVPKAPTRTPAAVADPVGNDLKTGVIKRIRAADHQGVNDTRVVNLESGRTAAFKPAAGERKDLLTWIKGSGGVPGDLATREVAASEFDRFTGWGIVPRTVMRKVDEMGVKATGSMQEWIKNAKVANDFSYSEVARMMAKSPRGQQMEFMDLLLINSDRHGANFIFDQSENVWAIDNGLCCANSAGRIKAASTEWRSRMLGVVGKTDDSIIRFVENTDPKKLQSVMEGAGLDADAASGVANRLKVMKDNVDILKTDTWGESYEKMRRVLRDEGF